MLNKILSESESESEHRLSALLQLIFILNLTPGFNGLGKDNYKMTREAFKFWDLVRSYIRDFTVYDICDWSDDVPLSYTHGWGGYENLWS